MRRHFLLLLLGLGSLASAQTKTITFEDAKTWENLGPTAISRDGHWVTYNISLVDGDGRLVLRNVDTPQRKDVVGGGPAGFSDDSKWAAYLISPPRAEADRMRAERKQIRTKLAVFNLANGSELVLDDVMRFRFIKGGHHLIAQRYRPETRKEGGSDLVVIDLATGTPMTFGNVADAQSNENGDLLALRIEPETGENGIQMLDFKSGRLSTLFWGPDEVGAMVWSERADALGYLIGRKDDSKQGIAYRPYLAKGFGGPTVAQYSFDPFRIEGMPAGYRVTENGFDVNESGTALALGVAPWKDVERSKTKPEDRPGVEVWNTKDVDTIPQQRLSLENDRRKTTLALWFPDKNLFRTFGDGKFQQVRPLGDFDRVLVDDPTPYRVAASNGVEYSDISVVDATNGTKQEILRKTAAAVIPSRKGGYLAYFEGGNWWRVSTAGGKAENLTAKLGSNFYQDDYDGTSPIKPFADGPDWLADDAGLIVYDNHDAYLCRPDAAPVRLSNMAPDHASVRLLTVSQKQAREGVSVNDRFYFSVTNRDNASSGIYACNAAGVGKVLTYDAALISGFRRAEDVDRAIFVMQSFEKSPDLYVTNLDITQAKPVSKLNPQQKDFAWPKSELIEYKSRFGKPLRGILVYPANYQKNRRYPMVTYIYEKLSDQFTRYQGPNPWNSYNVQLMAQNGYFVLMPDITYQPRNPGKSAVDCLEPALYAVFAKKVGVDPDKVGLMGHSWGAYQTAYVTTVSKMFRVGVAGAPLTELTSMYNSFYWNSGVSDQVLFEISQGRMEVPFWQDPKSYIENSPVWQSEKRTAPILFESGTADGAVDYHQSLYLYQTLRRMGKDAVFLLYEGENHGLAKRANQLDYATRLRHYFDVYLKSVKPEPWVTEGVPLTVQKKED